MSAPEGTLHAWAAGTFVPMLTALSAILDKATAHSAAPDKLPAARLAADMYPLSLQVQLACHHAEEAAARLTGRDVPGVPDVEGTIDALKQRLTTTIVHLERVPASAFAGAEVRKIEIPLPDAAFVMNGLQYLRDWAFPHFYFHVVTAYDILRHHGIPIGKRDYASGVGVYIRPTRA